MVAQVASFAFGVTTFAFGSFASLAVLGLWLLAASYLPASGPLLLLMEGSRTFALALVIYLGTRDAPLIAQDHPGAFCAGILVPSATMVAVARAGPHVIPGLQAASPPHLAQLLPFIAAVLLGVGLGRRRARFRRRRQAH